MSEIASVLRLAGRHRGRLATGSFLLLGESAAALGVPWLAGLIAGSMVASAAESVSLPMLLLAMLALFGLQALFRFASGYVLGSAAEAVVADLKVRLYDHLQALPLAFYQRRRLGDTLALLASDVYVVGQYVAETLVGLIPLVVTSVGAIVFMLHIRVDLAVLAVLLVPAFYLCTKIIGRKLGPLTKQLQDEHANAIAMAHENLSLIHAIKTFTREKHESVRYHAQVEKIRRLSAGYRLFTTAFGPAVQFVAVAAVVIVLGLASSDIEAGRLTAAQLVAFLLYAQLLARPVSALADVYGRTQAVKGASARLRAAMDEAPELAPDVGLELREVRGDIEYRGVTFAYEGRGNALDEVDLEIRAGETVALVGPNGAGKSTLAHLLMRLHDAAGGSITIDGVDVARVSLASLRRQIGIVPQHVLLFNASVRDNIAYGKVGAGRAAIEAAARTARAHDFIMALPDGYDTLIGDRGMRLSGGQQQRIALARALLKDPPILVLDEATSMYDPAGEEEFLRASREGLRGRTVILITHRPASLATADRVVHLDRGRITRIESRSASAATFVA